MQDPNWQRIKQLFTAAAALPPDQHTAFLAANEPDAAIRAEVLSLLAAHSPTVAPGANTDGPRVEGPGSRIGPYKLLEVIGEGGFGVVYAAEQESPVRRRVALKIVKAGMDSRQVIARFEQERQALALMDHPNIARVFDGGATPSGRPFFVMELVKGDPITEYCDREKLTTAERLRLFVDVGRAVQHAHTKGVIHRDLKPSNVLVTLVDGKAIAKVIDFGVAKATQGRLTDKTLFTEHKQMIGTPLYMSPEQAHISGVDVDTRSDVYSLGVLLYELLTGTTPFRKEELLDAGLAEMHRVLREVEPQKPSTRVATLGKTSGAVAAQRRVEVAKWNALLRGDLDWIVMKCLEKERARRYETANDLARDVERHLAGDAVLAAPPSLGYRVRKFVHRRRAHVTASVMIAVLAATGMLAFAWSQAMRATDALKAKHDAEEQTAVANRLRRESRFAFVAAADSALRAGDVTVARERLEECEPELRGWAWGHVDEQTDRSSLVLGDVDPSEQSAVIASTFSVDGSLIHAAVANQSATTFRTYDAASGKLLGAFPRPHRNAGVDHVTYHARSGVVAVAFTEPHDGSPATGSTYDVLLLDIHSGTLLRPLHGHTAKLACSPAFSSDGRRVITCAKDKTLKVWNAVTGIPEADLRLSDGDVEFVASNEDGTLAATVTTGTSIWLWNIKTGQSSRIAAFPDRGFYALACSRDLSTIALASGLLLTVWHSADMSTREIAMRRGIQSLCMSPTGDNLLVTSDTGPCWLLTLYANRSRLNASMPQPLQGHRDAVLCGSFSPDGARIVTGSVDGTLRTWDAYMTPSIEPVDARPHSCELAYSGDGSCFIVGESGGKVTVNDTNTGSPVSSLRPARPSDRSVRLNHTASRLVSDDGPHEPLLVWDVTSGRLLRNFNIDRRCDALSADGQLLIVGTNDGSLLAFSGQQLNDQRHVCSFDSPVTGCAIADAGDLFAAASSRGEVEVCGRRLLAPLLRFSAISDVRGLQFDRTGGRIAVKSDKCVQVWILAGQEARLDHSYTISADTKYDRDQVRVSPDFKYILAISDDCNNATVHCMDDPSRSYRVLLGGTVNAEIGWSSDHLYYADRERITCLDLITGRKILSLSDERHWPCAVVASPDGSELLATDVDGGSVRRFHSRRYAQRYPTIQAIRQAAEQMRKRLAEVTRQQIADFHRQVMAHVAMPSTERAGARIALCEAEERLRARASDEINALFEQFKTAADLKEMAVALASARRICEDFPEEYAFREIEGALLYRAEQFEAAEAALAASTTDRSRYTNSPSFVGTAFTLLASSRLLHRDAAEAARARLETFDSNGAPWTIALRHEAMAAHEAAFGGRK